MAKCKLLKLRLFGDKLKATEKLGDSLFTYEAGNDLKENMGELEGNF